MRPTTASQTAHGWGGRWRTNINLRNFVAGDPPYIANLEYHLRPSIRSTLGREFGISKRRIAESIAEGVEGLDVLLIKPSIAHKYAFAVGCFAVNPRVSAFGMCGIIAHIVRQLFAPSEGQAVRPD